MEQLFSLKCDAADDDGSRRGGTIAKVGRLALKLIAKRQPTARRRALRQCRGCRRRRPLGRLRRCALRPVEAWGVHPKHQAIIRSVVDVTSSLLGTYIITHIYEEEEDVHNAVHLIQFVYNSLDATVRMTDRKSWTSRATRKTNGSPRTAVTWDQKRLENSDKLPFNLCAHGRPRFSVTVWLNLEDWHESVKEEKKNHLMLI